MHPPTPTPTPTRTVAHPRVLQTGPTYMQKQAQSSSATPLSSSNVHATIAWAPPTMPMSDPPTNAFCRPNRVNKYALGNEMTAVPNRKRATQNDAVKLDEPMYFAVNAAAVVRAVLADNRHAQHSERSTISTVLPAPASVPVSG